MEAEKKDVWKYVLLNGRSRFLQVKDAVFDKGKLTAITDLRPFQDIDAEGRKIEPTAEIANAEKRKAYIEFFKKPFKNLLILSGAGSSMDVGGLSMAQLWEEARKTYSIEKTEETEEIDGFKIIQETVNYTPGTANLEALLSRIEGFCKFSGDCDIEWGTNKKKLTVIKDEIFNLIKEKCTIPTPKESFPHQVFLEKILQRKQTSPRVKLFTLNYDLLFENAATSVNAIVIDGFSYTFPRTFSGRFFDYDIVQREGSKLKEEDNFIQRVFHLHKLHGSINWELNTENGSVEIKEDPRKALMVYPRDAKYEDSYEQPFFEMMARFQRNLRLNNDTLLICIGYSFNDKHINAAIEEALNQNPGFRLAVIDPRFDDDTVSNSLKTIRENALKSDRIMLVSETFTDFASHFPEIKTYDSPLQDIISLKNE